MATLTRTLIATKPAGPTRLFARAIGPPCHAPTSAAPALAKED
jgi:hypothetical protein